jgi:micrococcal nuclease
LDWGLAPYSCTTPRGQHGEPTEGLALPVHVVHVASRKRAAPPSPPSPEDKLARLGKVVAVSYVVDGDTFNVSPAVGAISRLRLIGVDTPETYGGTEPYGPEASAFAKQQIDGEEVGLELDVQKVDPYGRLLAYVYLPDGEMFNEVLLEEGYAKVATFPPNVRYVDRFLEAQREARTANRGLWGHSAGELCQQTNRGNGIGGGCTGSESES